MSKGSSSPGSFGVSTSEAMLVDALGAASTHCLDALPLSLLNLEQRIGRFDQVAVGIERNLARDARDRDLRQAVRNLLPIERIGGLNGLDHRECGVIRKGRIQFDILIEAHLVALAEVLRRWQLVESGARFQILGAFAGGSGDLQERVALERTRAKELRLHAKRAHLFDEHRALLIQAAKEDHVDVLAL